MPAPVLVAVVQLPVRLEILALRVKSGSSRGGRLWLRPQAALWITGVIADRAMAGVVRLDN